ncbi:MAG: hypothetical protein LBO03_09595 [Acidaminococcales bacterium]|jgi:type I restriction enzyme S subunit|nr:hypothetical protein [Acidaminococcales bacterium]
MWFGILPKHWDTTRLASVFTERNEKVSDAEYAPLSVTKNGILPQLARAAKTDNGDNRKRVCVGDFVINSRSDRKGSSGVSTFDGSVSLINMALVLRGSYDLQYLHHLLKSHDFIEEYYRMGRGIVADLWTTRFSEMKTIQLPLPPLVEQNQIVQYLDWQTSRLNTLINARKRQVALLREAKQAAINEAVTRRDEGWQDISLGNLGNFRKGFGGSRTDDDENGVACIRYGDIYRTGKMILVEPITRIKDSAKDFYARIQRLELLFALSGETKEEIGQALVNDIAADTWTSGDAAIFTCNNSIRPMFLTYALRCPYILKQRVSRAKGDIIVHISVSALRQLRLLVPPISEQEEIVANLNKQCMAYDSAISAIENENSLLAEYRTRLISDVVTGKIDVRGVAVPEYERVEALNEVEDAEEVQEDTENAD